MNKLIDRMNNVKFVLTIILIVILEICQAQTIELKTNTLNSGSETSTSTSFQLNGAVGEISSGPSTSTNFVLNSGFTSNRFLLEADQPILVAHYPLDGNPMDATGNGYDGSVSGVAELTTDVAGLPEKAYFFNGFDSKVYHTLAEPVNFAAFTISAWVYLENPADTRYQTVIALESTQIFEIITYEGKYALYHENGVGGGLGIIDLGATSAGWHHVAASWDGATLTGYVDGVALNNRSDATTPNFDVTSFSLGASNLYGEFLEGALDEVKIFNYILPFADIQNLYLSYPPPPTAPQNLVAKVVGPDAVKLTWDDGPDETFYYVYWNDGLSNTDEAGLPANTTSYSITGMTPGVEHYIEVGAGHDFSAHDNYYAASEVFKTPVQLGTPIVEVSKPLFTLDETITITYYPANSYPAGELTGATKVYMHAGLISPENVALGAWSYTVGNWGTDDFTGLMDFNGTDAWTLTITPRTYFGAPADFSAAQVAMVFRNEDGSLVGKAAGEEDIKVQVFDDKNIGPIGSFIPTTISTDIYIDDAATSTTTPANVQIENMAAFTMEALVKYNQEDPNPTYFYNLIGRRVYDDVDQAYYTYHGLIFYNNGTSSAPAGYFYTDANWYLPESTIPYLHDTWTHMALVYNGADLSLYVNGKLQGSLATSGNPLLAEGLQMGSFEGAMDELRFWNYARSEEELRANIRNEVSTGSAGLTAYWPMNEITNNGTDDITPDATGNGNDLIVSGAQVQDLPDLKVTHFVAPPALVPGELINIDYTVENTGLGDAGPHSIGLFLSSNAVLDNDELLASIDLNGLLAGTTTSGSLSGIIDAGVTAGDYYVILAADFNLQVEENDETNNYVVSLINIDPANANGVAMEIWLDYYDFYENNAVDDFFSNLYNNDPNTSDNFEYNLVDNTTYPDNDLFYILGDALYFNHAFNYETDAWTYNIQIEVNDGRGGVHIEVIEVYLRDANDPPIEINLSNTSDNIYIVVEGTYSNHPIGVLSTTDEDAGDTHTYEIVNDGGALSDGVTFDIITNFSSELVVSGTLNPGQYIITILSTDLAGAFKSEVFTISITPAGIAPTGILLSNNIINESHGGGAFIGQFSTIDEDSDQHTYILTNNNDGKFAVGQNDGRLIQAVDIPEDEYLIEVETKDNTGLVAHKSFTIYVVSNVVEANTVLKVGEQVEDYRIIGVPFKSATISGTFNGLGEQGTGWRILSYTYQDNKVTDLSSGSTMTGGVGYWFLSKNAVTIELGAGDLNNGATFSKSLSVGWNLIANPFLGPLDWDAVVAYNLAEGIISSGDLGIGIVYTYGGGFSQSSGLAIMQGGFVYATTAMTLSIPSSTLTTGSRISLSNKLSQSYYDQADEWQLFFDLSSGSKTTNISAIGISKEATDLEDPMDMSPPPSFQLPFQLTEKATGLTKNLKPNEKTVIWDYLLTGAVEMTTISWDQRISGHLDKPLMLALLPQSHVIDLRAAGEITFLPAENQSVMFIYGTELPQELLSGSISAYPNPVDQEVSFRFYVDGEGVIPASVELFNLSGQRLGAINQNVKGGSWTEIQYKVATEDILKSGIYLFKVKYSDFESAVKKLIVR